MAYLIAPTNAAINTQLTDLAVDTANGGNWLPHPDYIGTLRIGDATVRCFSNTLDTDEALYYSNAVETANFDVQVQFGRWGAGALDNFVAFCYRVQLGGKSYYRVRYNGTDWLLEKVVAGVATTLGTVATPDPLVSLGAPVVVDIHVEGNNHFVWITDATGAASRTTINAIDSTFTTGVFGIWGSCGGATTGTAPTHTPTNGMYISYSATTMLVAANSAVMSPPAPVFTITAASALSAESAVGGVSISGAADVFFVTNIMPTGGLVFGGNAGGVAYDISLEFMPNGGVKVGGVATVKEAINYQPLGGAVVGGSAVVLERIPFKPTGGILVSGSPSNQGLFSYIPTGGAVIGGAAPIVAKYVPPPLGGAVVGGAATVNVKHPFFAPSGGIRLGGAASIRIIVDGVLVFSSDMFGEHYFGNSYWGGRYWGSVQSTGGNRPENPNGYPFPGWAVNMETFAPSRYSGLPANSIARFMDRPYVSNDGGIYLMDADDDAGSLIHASVEMAETDFNDSREKGMEIAYIGVKTEGRMRLMVRVNGSDPEYYAVMPNSNTHKGTVVRIGKGLKGRYWAARIDNEDGADFDIESVELIPYARQRRGA